MKIKVVHFSWDVTLIVCQILFCREQQMPFLALLLLILRCTMDLQLRKWLQFLHGGLHIPSLFLKHLDLVIEPKICWLS